jgi:2-haloacid dehalogenase
MGRPTVVVFDVNETLLDLTALEPAFIEGFGDANAMMEWFTRTLHGSLVASTLGIRETFATIAASALDAQAQTRAIELDGDVRDGILRELRMLPAHGDVRGALEELRAAGFSLAALTNSPRELAIEQLEHAGIAASFDPILSVEATGRFKPHAETYLAAARAIGVPIGRIRMVAAHDWDVAGALGAGARGAFVERAAASFRDWLPRPDIEASDLGAVARAIVELDSPSQS